MRDHNYYVYILTNKSRKVLYTGVTNNLKIRLHQHVTDLNKGFTSKYKCHYLVYYEHHTYVIHAIEREKVIKGWIREKKNKLISDFNPDWEFLNERIYQEL